MKPIFDFQIAQDPKSGLLVLIYGKPGRYQAKWYFEHSTQLVDAMTTLSFQVMDEYQQTQIKGAT